MANGQNAPHAQAAEEALALHKGMPDDPAKYGVEGCCYRTFWAVVETDGTFVRGRNVARVAHLAPGQYEIVFTSDVSEGVYVATIGRPAIPTQPTADIRVPLPSSLTP